jgi:caa(3)-type oxidase subunit IV
MSDTTHAEHPSVKHYIKIFVLLAVLTAVELAVVLFKLPKTWLVLSLVVLAAWKAVLVAMHFMHLKMDPRRLSFTVIAPVVALLIFVLIISFESLVKHHIPFTDAMPPAASAPHAE